MDSYIRPLSGVRGNARQKVIKGLEQAQREQVEVVSCTECFLTGYPDNKKLARKHAFALRSPEALKLLDRTARFDPTFVAGFNQLRGRDLYNTVLVAHKGHVLGTSGKCSASMPFHKPGRDFPICERGGVKFGVVICSDGGYIEHFLGSGWQRRYWPSNCS